MQTYQTICDYQDEDSLRACIASLLDIAIETVPHFQRFQQDRWKKLANFLKDYNRTVVIWSNSKQIPPMLPTNQVIGIVNSKHDPCYSHYVIEDYHSGSVQWDPHPEQLYVNDTSDQIRFRIFIIPRLK